MGFIRTVPSSVSELSTYLQKIFENRKHVRGVVVNPGTGHLEITLDGMAHFAGNPDVFLPIKRGKVQEAQDIIERVMREANLGHAPSDLDAQRIFELIDPAGQ